MSEESRYCNADHGEAKEFEDIEARAFDEGELKCIELIERSRQSKDKTHSNIADDCC